jgi:molybdenum cofactor cytidylyltransferase
MIAAIVPAAGASTRMGRPKLTLPVGGRPVIERVVTALRTGGADPVIVVTGPHDPAVAPLARAAGADVCELAAATPDMRATVEHGLRWLEERYHPRPDDAWLLCPADCPLLDAAVVRQLCEAYRSGTASILVPTHGGRRGHPVLMAWHHVAGVQGLAAGVGIDAYLRENAGCTRQVSVHDGGVLTDMDTPAEYDLMRPTDRT